MRLRAAVVTGVAVALATVVQGPAQAAPMLPVAASAAVPEPARSADPRAAAKTFTLITGQRVHLVGAPGHERVIVDAKQHQAAGDALVVRRLAQHLYVFPVAIEPLLGRSVDLALFDLHAVRTDTDGRTAVRVAYTGSRPSVPGLHVSAAKNGVAQGYVTTRSAPAFGAHTAGRCHHDQPRDRPRARPRQRRHPDDDQPLPHEDARDQGPGRRRQAAAGGSALRAQRGRRPEVRGRGAGDPG
jgi:hypothetical protein